MISKNPIFCCLTFLVLLAQSTVAHAEKRVALVVGNSKYQNVGRLDNPANDASLIAGTLKDLGFVLVGDGAQLDLEKPAMDLAVQKFGMQLQGADVALFYYAGHGVQVRGSNYLVPVNANPVREADVDFQMTDVNLVLNQMQGSGTRLNLVILDACRNNPFGGRGLRSSEGGLAQIRAPEGSLISYATQPGNVALDGTDGHSPYTAALASTLRRPGLDIFQTFNQVGLAVKKSTNGSQQPWVSSSPIDGTFYFANAPANGATTPTPTPLPQQEARLSSPMDSLRPDLVTDCDRLAASPLDDHRSRGIAGVRAGQMEIVPALAACNAALVEFPDVARFMFQAGRVADIQQDYGRARELYENAISRGYWLGATNLGILHQLGQGVPVNFTEARKWFEKGGAAKEPTALNRLGLLYLEGKGVSKNLTQARTLFENAAARGYSGAMVNLGNLYWNGTGVTQDFGEARRWFDKAVQAAVPDGAAF